MSRVIPEWQAYQEVPELEFDKAVTDKFEFNMLSGRSYRDPDGKVRMFGRLRPNCVFEGAPLGSAIEL
ncbi:MAG TPA: hypothetical protein VMR76_01015 [Candidatus Saccharimonadia bacterium]|nr:hypothetical protein [Candidatus Saccharimonadia bacterium]